MQNLKNWDGSAQPIAVLSLIQNTFDWGSLCWLLQGETSNSPSFPLYNTNCCKLQVTDNRSIRTRSTDNPSQYFDKCLMMTILPHHPLRRKESTSFLKRWKFPAEPFSSHVNPCILGTPLACDKLHIPPPKLSLFLENSPHQSFSPWIFTTIAVVLNVAVLNVDNKWHEF